MRMKLGAAGAGMAVGLLLLTGCTTNVYHVMKAENHFYIIPMNEWSPGDESDDAAESAVPVLTRGGTNYLVVPRSAPVRRY